MVYVVEEVEDVYFFVMELIEGVVFDDLIFFDGMCFEDFFCYFVLIVEVLVVVYDCGIMYCDIKFINVMVIELGYVKVFDFGFVKFDFGIGLNIEVLIQMLIEEGSIIGIVLYMVLEQFIGCFFDVCIDFFFVGIFFYQMLMGSCFFLGDSLVEFIFLILCDKFDFVFEIKLEFFNYFGCIVCCCFEKDLDCRYQMVFDLCNEIQDFKLEIDSGVLQMFVGVFDEVSVLLCLVWLLLVVVVVVFVLVLLVGFGLCGGGDVFEELLLVFESLMIMIVVLLFEEFGDVEMLGFLKFFIDEVVNCLMSFFDVFVVLQSMVEQSVFVGVMVKEIGEFVGVDYVFEGLFFWLQVEVDVMVLCFIECFICVEDDIQVFFYDQFSEFENFLCLQLIFVVDVVELFGGELFDLLL